jgi:hypothetical protein
LIQKIEKRILINYYHLQIVYIKNNIILINKILFKFLLKIFSKFKIIFIKLLLLFNKYIKNLIKKFNVNLLFIYIQKIKIYNILKIDTF